MKKDCLTNLNWFKRMAMLSLLLLAFGLQSFSQNKVVTGTVTSADDGMGVPGVSVVVKGTTAGTSTDIDGKYQISIPSEGKVLIFSFVGMTTQEIAINSDVIDVVMATDATQMDEVVVTALGIKREKKALGYAVSEVKGDELVEARENNLANSLAGKVAGVQITKTAGGPAASSRVIIRGVANLNGNNQPMYVVDGIPINNNTVENAENNDNGGIDGGDGISSLNPDDIETLSVLKGPAATALYGSRAINGVIVITTKSGAKKDGIGVEFNSNFTMDNPLVLPDFQKVYGNGENGKAPETMEDAVRMSSSWGAKIEGQEGIPFYDGKAHPYKAYDNDKNFYETGRTYNNSLSFFGGNEKSTFRFSYANLDNKGVIPNTGYKRNNFTLRGSSKMGKNEQLTIDAKVSYINEKATNRPFIGNSVLNTAALLLTIPYTYDIRWLKNYKDENGMPIGIGDKNNNPYWNQYEVINSDTRDRLLGFVTARYQFFESLSLQVRAGTDYFTRKGNALRPLYTPWYTQGYARESTVIEREDNYDFLFQFQKDLNEEFNLSMNFGGSQSNRKHEETWVSGEGFDVPELQHPGSGRVQKHGIGYHERRTNSLYGSAQMAFRNYWFVEVTGRNDWSSTLTQLDGSGENSYFYPSVSSSLVFSDAFDLPEFISFGKVRTSWAQVGGDTSPYRLNLLYGLDGDPHVLPGGSSIVDGSISNGEIPLSNLKPSSSTSYEVGLDVRFFQNRLGVDVTYYTQDAKNQILGVDVSNASGFGSAVINAGKIENSGLEVMLTGTPVRTKDFSWDVMVNYSKNDNEVVSLEEGIEKVLILRGGGTNGTVAVEARPGKEYGLIVGRKYVRNENGDIILQNGKPMASETAEILGSAYPAWMGGIKNTFRYKNFSLSALVDVRYGGQLYSGTEAASYSAGKHKNTLPGREEFITNGKWIPEGIMNTGTEEEPVWEANNVDVKPSDYYGAISNIDEQFIYDADFVKLREVSFKYNFPKAWFNNAPVESVSLAVVARNLAYLYKATDNIDPESTYTNGNGQGMEVGSLPSSRSFGFNLNVKF